MEMTILMCRGELHENNRAYLVYRKKKQQIYQGETTVTEDLHSDKGFLGWTENNTVLGPAYFSFISIILVIYVDCNQ